MIVQHPKGRNPNSRPAAERLLTREEVAITLGISKRTLSCWIAAGKVPPPTHRFSRKSVKWRESVILTLVQQPPAPAA